MAKETLQKIETDKDAFNGPFTCHGKTKLIKKKMSIKDNTFSYEVWQCPKCKKEILDTAQANYLEAIWTFEKLVTDKTISMERAVNYDGKMFFLRFPKELTKTWHKGDNANIKAIDTKRFVIEIN